jgi:hypothetical protein
MVYNDIPDEVGLVASSIDEELSEDKRVPEVQKHIFVAEKPRWYRISGDAPQWPGNSEP